MRIVICDDDAVFGKRLQAYLKELSVNDSIYGGNFLIDYVSSADTLLSNVSSSDVDILFLDISMPGTDGFEIAKKLTDEKRDICLIFVSNYDEKVYYSLRFKPFRFVRKSNYKEEAKEAFLSAIYNVVCSNQSIMIKDHSDVTYVRIPNIYYISKEKMTNYVIIHTYSQKYRYRSTIDNIKASLSNFGFINAGQNLLVNSEHVFKIERNEVLLDNSERLTLSSGKIASSFSVEYMKYMRIK